MKYCPHDEIGSGEKKKSRGAERELQAISAS